MKSITSLVLMGLAGMALVGCGQTSTDSLGAATANAPKPPNRVVVYYMHRTFRCFSCQWIESTTRQTLKETFPSELASGRLEFHVEDYMKREDLAKRYDVQTVSVVVVNVVDGQEVSHQTLEKVWDLKMKNNEFRAYITEAVRAALGKTK
jgi:hypothetical protein